MPALLLDSDFTLFNTENYPSSPSLADAVAFALQKYPGFNFLPSNYDSIETHLHNASPATAHFSCDDFRMYEFKVRRCMRGRSHDWTECPFAHPGEKARRRDPRRIHYSGAPCPDFRKGSCRRGDACEFAHGVFECWLHPARYRTQVCKDGRNCKRRVCFFAHSPQQLRILPSSPSSYAHTGTAEGSPVGSPCSLLSQHNLSLEIPSSPVAVGSAGSTAQFLPIDGACMPNDSAHNNSMKGFPPAGTMVSLGSSNLASSDAFTSRSAPDMSPMSIHLDSLNAGSPLRRAMAQSFLAGKNYSGGSFSLNVPNANTTEYSPVFDSYHPTCAASPQSHPVSGNTKLREDNFFELSLQLGALESSHSYELLGYSQGFPSPTSTLAGGHTFSPPPLSPPLSPLSSPNPTNCQSRGGFTNLGQSFHNFFVDDATFHKSSNGAINTYSADCMDDLALRLQQLQVPQTFEPMGFSLRNPNESRLGMLESSPLKALHSRLPTRGHSADGLSFGQKESMWSPLSKISSEDYSIEYLQLKDSSMHETAGKICGEEGITDNLMPDFGWVSELVK